MAEENDEPYRDSSEEEPPPPPPAIFAAIARMNEQGKLQAELNAEVNALAQEMVGRMEAGLYPELLTALQNDPLLTGADLIYGIAGYYHVVNAMRTNVTPGNYWAAAHVCDALARRFQEEAKFQRAAGEACERVFPGSTSHVGDLVLPKPQT